MGGFAVQLTPRQRIALENAIASQPGKARDLRVFAAVLDKIECRPEYRREYLRAAPGGGASWDEDALALAEPFACELEREECNRILDVLDDWPHFTAADMKWITPLRKQLRGLLEEHPASRLTKMPA